MSGRAKFGVGLAVLGFAAALVVPGCGRAPNVWKDVPGGPTKVMASFPPLFCFAKSVAGDDAAVLCLLETTGPHEFRPEKMDALKLREANLFLVNGLGLDDWVPQMVTDSHNHSLKVVKVGQAVPEAKLLAMEEHEHEKEHGHAKEEHEHHHGEHDPHVWLGLPEAVYMVERIRDALKEQDPGHAADFDKRAGDYVRQLRELHDYGKKKFAGRKNRKFIAMHESLRYFARAFDLDLVDSIQPQPGVEADARKLAELVEVCRKENVRVIAVEPQYSRTTAETLRRQLKKQDIRIVTVDPIETADPPLRPGYYLERMRANIDALAEHMQ